MYDSIYTERYLGLPSENPGGYVNASVTNVTAFHKVRFGFSLPLLWLKPLLTMTIIIFAFRWIIF